MDRAVVASAQQDRVGQVGERPARPLDAVARSSTSVTAVHGPSSDSSAGSGLTPTTLFEHLFPSHPHDQAFTDG